MWVRFLIGRGLQVKPVEQDIPEICAPSLRQELNREPQLGGGTLFLRGLAGISLLWFLLAVHLVLAFLWPSLFVFSVMVPAMGSYWTFCFAFGINLAMLN